MNVSPAGLAVWIIEKFRTWSDCAGDVEKSFTKDELVTNLTIYWAAETSNSAMRLYYESAHDRSNLNAESAPVCRPRWRCRPPLSTRRANGTSVNTNVQRWTELKSGGHFAEWKVPESIAEDIRKFFRPSREM